jgi:hypothetical protein
MSSTRNKNTLGDFQAEQEAYMRAHSFMTYEHSSYVGVPSVSYFQGDGLVGMKTAHRNLSQNYCDIENQLFGIGSTNLITPLEPITPQIYQMSSLNISERLPKQLPQPFVPETNHRPMYLN